MALLPSWMPHLADAPMSLGDHLHELRRRLVWPVIVLAASFLVAVGYQADLKKMLIWPLQRAIHIVGVDVAAAVGLNGDGTRLLQAFDLSESTMLSFSVAFDVAIALTLPVALYHLWKFVAVGLKDKERKLGFLFIPLGVIFFYIGMVVGYFFGLPYFYAWLIEWHFSDPTARNLFLGMTLYHGFFVTMTICFGLVMDIPWLVLVLLRVRLVTVEQLVKYRKIVIVVNLIAAAMITPTGDPVSLAALFFPMQLLFELGLMAGRVMMWQEKRKAESTKLEASAGEGKTEIEPHV